MLDLLAARVQGVRRLREVGRGGWEEWGGEGGRNGERGNEEVRMEEVKNTE